MLDQTVTVETTAAQPGELSTESTYIGTISAEGTASVVSLVSRQCGGGHGLGGGHSLRRRSSVPHR